MEDNDEMNNQRVQINHRVEAALHYSIGKICEEKSTENDMMYSKPFTACLTKTIVSMGELFANDLESFSRHAKRTTITVDDVKLLVRRNKELAEKLNEHCLKFNLEKVTNKHKQKKRKSDASEEKAGM